ncbi:MAG: hypothetical protein HQL56_07715 [Magnetococcales bacterium]|nr:hypothetical protein [Magnetococcales bacterium]
MPSQVNPFVTQAVQKCLGHLSPLFEAVRKKHDGSIPDAMKEDHYLLGYIKGMLMVQMGRCGQFKNRERGLIILEVFGHLFDSNSRIIGERLSQLHLERDDVEYLEGVNDGGDRLLNFSEGRKDEVIYKLMNRLEKYL